MAGVGETDIIVVGAGVVGSAVAYELVRRGATVSLLDSRVVGAGATQASGGMLAPYTEAVEGGPLMTLGARSLGLFGPMAAAVQAEAGIDVKYGATGSLHCASADASLAHFERTCSTLAALGVPATRLSAADVRALEPDVAGIVLGGMLLPTQGMVSAPALTRAFTVAAQRRGATLLEGTRVIRVSPRAADVAVETDKGLLRARTVVLATGAWAGTTTVEGAAAVPVTPVRGQLLHLQCPDASLSHVTWDEHCYVVPWQDGTLLVGATTESVGFDERTTVVGVKGLLDAVSRLLPVTATAHLLSARAGLRPATPDGLPVIGWSPHAPGVMYATGHYRNGVLLAPLTAVVVADAIVDGERDPILDLTDPVRFGAV